MRIDLQKNQERTIMHNLRKSLFQTETSRSHQNMFGDV